MLVDAPSRWLYTSGVVPSAPDGTTPPDVGAQARLVWDNIAAILEQHTAICAAIRNRDPEAAFDAMRAHITYVIDFFSHRQ